MIQKGVLIRDDQEEWLKKHPSVNLSGLLRTKLDELIKKLET